MYSWKSCIDDCSDTCNGNHNLDASGFTCLDKIVGPQLISRIYFRFWLYTL